MKYELNSAILYFTMKEKEAEEKEQKYWSSTIADELIQEGEQVLKNIQHEKDWNFQMIAWLQELKDYRNGAN